MSTQDIAARFARETAEHEMTILHDDGLYRHVRFTPNPPSGQPRHSMYWFDLITVPGALIFQGDGESYVFRRVDDMFEFFRRPVGQINPSYWSEKLTDGRDRVMKYDQELLAAAVTEAVAQYYENGTVPDGLMDAIQSDVLDEFCGDESWDLEQVDSFRFYANDNDRYDHRKRPDFEFTDISDWRVRDYDWWFLWACQAIVWGIAQYDARRALPRPITSATPRRLREAKALNCTPLVVTESKPDTRMPKTATDRSGARRSIVDVQLPEPAGATS